jgi:hypothetical protein
MRFISFEGGATTGRLAISFDVSVYTYYIIIILSPENTYYYYTFDFYA